MRTYYSIILKEMRLVNAKHIDTRMDANVRLLPNQRSRFKYRYKRLVGNLNDFTLTLPNISFVVSVVDQFPNSSSEGHSDVVISILKDIKVAPGKGLIYKNKGYI